MTPRERVFLTLQRRIPDRIAKFEIWIDGLHAELGCPDPVAIYAHLGQEEEDVRPIHRLAAEYLNAKIADPETYAERCARGLDAVEMSEDLTEGEKLLEAIMLGLRTTGGIDMEKLLARYRIDIKRTRPLLEHLAREGYVIKDGSNLLLSTKGICVHETVSELLASAVGRVTA